MISRIFAVPALISALFWLVALGMIQTASASEDEDMAKVVYHADFADPRRFSAMLTSINNMVTHYQNNLVEYDVRIVFVAHGIRFVTDDKLDGTPFQEDADLQERRENLKGRLTALREKGSTVAGDVNPSAVRGKAGWLTPVPGGVGPLTIAQLLANTLQSARRAAGED